MPTPATPATSRFSRSFAILIALLLLTVQSGLAAPLPQSDVDGDTGPILTAVTLDGPSRGQTSTPHAFVAQIFPKTDGAHLTYTWSPEPFVGQGTPRAYFVWDVAGKQTVKVTATQADGKGVSADHTISIRPPTPRRTDQIEIEALSSDPLRVGDTVTARLLIPAGDLAAYTVVWTPFPDEGQGKPQATFSWNTPGVKSIQATLVSADDTRSKASTTVTVIEKDADHGADGDDSSDGVTVPGPGPNIYLPSILGTGGRVHGAQVDEIQIVGGQEAEVGAWPWQAALMVDPEDPYTQFCGGSLIAPGWILTAGHCVDWWYAGTMYVVVGRHRLSSGEGDAVAVSQIILHPSYSAWSGDSDIALLRLARPLAATPMALETLPYVPGDAATVIGWGYTAEGDSSSASDVLMQVEVPMVSDQQCSAAYEGSITGSMICAGQAGRDSCAGDSGGPLMLPGGSTGWAQVGIVSWGYGCAREGYPGVYTKVENFVAWIQEQMATELEVDDFEPDDDIAQAKSIPVDGTTQTHTFHISGDQDWVWFDAVAGSTYTLETLNLTGYMDTILGLFDAGGSLLAADDDGADEPLASIIEWEAVYSGRHYLMAQPFYGGQGGNDTYDLRVRRDIYGDDNGPFEPNNTQSQATEIVVDEGPQTHSFHFPGDVDWIRFEATAGLVYRIETSNLAAGNDTVLYLVDGDGNDLIRNDDGGSGLGSQIEWLAVVDGPVYLRTRHYDPTVSGPELNYDLGVKVLPQDGSPAPYEPNDNLDSATPIGADGNAQTHDFYVAGDEDWLRFSALEGVTYLIETFNLDPGVDANVQIYSDASSAMTGVVDTGEGTASRLVWTAEANGEIYLRVRPYFADTGGPETGYDIRVSVSGSLPASPLEPNDSAEQATPIRIGTPLTDDFHSANDVDWGSFEAIAGATYVIETRTIGTASDTVVHLHNTSGAELAADDDSGEGYASRLEWTAAEAGRYFVRIRQYDRASGPATRYALTVSGATTAADAYESDDEMGSARPLALDADAQTHNFHRPGDVDWMRFDVEAEAGLVVETLNLADESDTVLALFDEFGLELARNDDDGSAAGSRINWRSDRAKTLYVAVSHFDQHAAGALTQYEIRVRRQKSSEPDAFESDDSLIEARPVTVGMEPQIHTFHAPGDVDWVRFEAAKDVGYRIETLNLAEKSDTVLTVIDSDGNTLLTDDDGGEGLASSALLTADESGLYFVGVRHYAQSAFGADTQYALSITQESGSSAGDAFEPDNEAAQATMFDPGEPAQTHNFHEPGDDDWIRFDTEVGVTYTITATGLEEYGFLSIHLYDQLGNLLSSVSDNGSAYGASIQWMAGYSGAYFIRAQATYNFAYGPWTAYEIGVGSSNVQVDEYEFDNNSATARPIAADGTIQSHTFHLPDDMDWVRIDAQTGAIYVINTLNLSPNCDTILHLFNSDGVILALDDDSGDGYASRIEWTATYTGVYYVRVSRLDNFGSEVNATYDLQMSAALPVETP